jgi:hypothetical protein
VLDGIHLEDCDQAAIVNALTMYRKTFLQIEDFQCGPLGGPCEPIRIHELEQFGKSYN